MPVYASELDGLGKSADALAEFILRGQADRQKTLDASRQAEKEAARRKQAIADNQAAAQAHAQTQGLKPGKYSMSVNEGGFNVNPEPAKDPLELLLRKAQIDMMQNEKDDKAVQQLSKRVEGAQLGPSQAALQNLGRSVQEKGVAIGPISANAPVWSVSLAEQLGLADKGATEQRQSVDALMAFQRNPLFGASLTPGEQQSFQNAFGLMTAGTPEQRVQAMSTLQALYNKATANVAAGSNQRIRDKYKAQGGISLEPSNVFEAPASGGMDPAKKARLEELRAKYRGR